MEPTTGLALVGAGYWGRRLARNLAAAPGCELRAVCDPHPVRARELADEFGGVASPSLADALVDDDIAAVVIATPATTHAALVGEALAASRHVLVEKPLAGSPADASMLAARAVERDLVVMCDQTYRFAPAVAAIRQLLADPSFGPVEVVGSCRTNDGHDQPDVDVFWDLAYHDLAIVDAAVPGGLRGEVEVRATACDAAAHGRAHRGELALELASGTRAHVVVDWHAEAKVRAMRFAGADHDVTWDDVGPVPVVARDGAAVAVEPGEPLAAAVAELLAAIADRRPASCGPAQELPILAVLTAATQSAARDGAAVTVALAPDDTAAVA